VNGKFVTEISSRVQKANQIYYQINQTIVGKKEVNNTKMGIYNTVYFPALFCGSEMWMTLTKHERRITGALENAWGKQAERELEIARLEEY
jgi:hypothetical protein